MDVNNPEYFCVTTSSIWQFAGYILFAIKIAVPLIIIILGILDFFKAMTAAKDDAINSDDNQDGVLGELLEFMISVKSV